MRTLVLSLATLSLLAVGCGGDEGGGSEERPSAKVRYERSFSQTIREWEERGEREAPDLPDDAPLPEQAEAVEVGIEMMRGLARDLGGLEPPAEVRVAHENYVRAVEGIAEDFKPVAAAMRRNDRAAVERLAAPGAGHFADPENVRLVVGARRAFEEHGYDLGLPELGVGG